MAGSKFIRRALPRAKAKRPATKAASLRFRILIDDLITGISLAECVQRSLSEQEIGAPEQVTLERARKCLWAAYDALEKVRG